MLKKNKTKCLKKRKVHLELNIMLTSEKMQICCRKYQLHKNSLVYFVSKGAMV